MQKAKFRNPELQPYVDVVESNRCTEDVREDMRSYDNLFESGKEKQEYLDKSPDLKVFEDIADKADKKREKFLYKAPRLDEASALFIGETVGTCLTVGSTGEGDLKVLFMAASYDKRLIIVLDEEGEEVGYGRYAYKAGQEKIVVDHIAYWGVDGIFDAVVRAILDQKKANNEAGKHPVDSIDFGHYTEKFKRQNRMTRKLQKFVKNLLTPKSKGGEQEIDAPGAGD